MKKMRKDRTNWKKVKALTEEQIVAAAKSDPDNKPLTRAQLKKFKRVNPPKEREIKLLFETDQSVPGTFPPRFL